MGSFQTTTISEIIDEINYSYLLPSIQREFVWDPDQMLDLFDSIVRGYPIGSFLFWRVKDDYAKQRIKYRFVEDYITEPIYPDELEGVTHHNQRYRDDFNTLPKRLNLVLDGQQRLTTLHLGLTGTLTDRGYNRRRDRVDSWTRKQLYLNLLSPVSERDHGRKYQFEFKQPSPPTDQNNYWYPVRKILDVNDAPEEVERVMGNIKDINNITVEEVNNKRKTVSRNLNNLYMSINENEVIPYFTEDEEDQEKVLDIFIRTNEGGTQLSKSDVLLSIATSHWQEGEERVVAREAIKKYVDKMNNHSARGGVTFTPNFVLRSLLLCSGSTSMTFTLDNFDDNTLSSMKNVWLEDDYKKAVLNTLNLIKSFGFTTSHIQSKMTLLPVLYFIYSDDPSLSWDAVDGKENRSRILYWLASMVVTGEMNSGGTVQTIQSVRNVIDSNPTDQFPLSEIERSINNYNKSMGLDSSTLDKWFGENQAGLKKSKVFLSLVYYPQIANEQIEYEIDHIFPKSEMRKDVLIDEYDIRANKAEEISKLSDSVSNLQLIKKDENAKKSDNIPEEWIPSRSSTYLDRHLIPTDKKLYQIGNFLEFVQKRRSNIQSELEENTPDRANFSQ